MSSAVRVARRCLPAPFALLALLALAPGAAPPLGAQTPATPENPLAVPSRTPPVRVTLSQEALLPGDRVRVLVRPRADGYLVVLHADPAGRVRVLFPLDPGDSQRMPGAMQRSIPSRDGSASFVVASTTGDGAVLAAISSSPFRTGAFASGGHWNVRAFTRLAAGADPEGELVAVARRMAAGKRFDYAVAPYRVTDAMPVVVYGGGGGNDQESDVRAASAPADGYYYDYYEDYYSYGYPLYYAGLFPALRWYGRYSPCVAHHGGGIVAGCGGAGRGSGRFSNRGRGPWGRQPTRRNAAAGTLAFPGNPSFGDPAPFGQRSFGPRAVPAPGAVSAPAGGGMLGAPIRPLGGGPVARPMAPPAPRPVPRMP